MKANPTASLDWCPERPKLPNYRELGQVDSKQLIAQLQLNQSGVPARPLQILITGELEEPDDRM